MILNILGKRDEGGYTFNLPNITLDGRLKYTICIHRVFLRFKTIADTFDTHDLLSIRSNLIDRSASNPTQSIVYIDYVKKNKQTQSYCSTGVILHPLQLLELGNATFTVCTLQGTAVKSTFEEIFLQIEIQKNNSYGWF